MHDAYAVNFTTSLNIFVTNLGQSLYGRGTFPWESFVFSRNGGIILNISAVGGHSLVHEIGHNFGLVFRFVIFTLI